MFKHISPNLDELFSRGWTIANTTARDHSLSEAIETLAIKLGKPVRSRGRYVVQPLEPLLGERAYRNSLSERFGLAELPLHADTSHWPVPCRYVILACSSATQGVARTTLLPVSRIVLNRFEQELVRRATFGVRNGRRSFFGTIASPEREFIRLDTGCMVPTDTDGVEAMALYHGSRHADVIERFSWSSGSVLIIDNWKVLHGRDPADDGKARLLVRVLVQ